MTLHYRVFRQMKTNFEFYYMFMCIDYLQSINYFENVEIHVPSEAHVFEVVIHMYIDTTFIDSHVSFLTLK